MKQNHQEGVVLEPSTHSHVLNGNVISVKNEISHIEIEVEGQGLIVHGEHGTICTESPHLLKFVQQEYNPVTKALQNAFD